MAETKQQFNSGSGTDADATAIIPAGSEVQHNAMDFVPSSKSEASPEESSNSTVAQDGQENITYVTGIRFWLISIALSLALFLTNLEIPIVTTSLVAITNDLGSFSLVSWLISSYLMGYVGVLVIFAKLSDIFGRKLMLASAISIFIIFSAACGAAQTLKQLIIFRAFQGIGGGGCFAISSVLISELVPPAKFAQYTANISSVYALSLLTGPILGGAISSNTTWRWVFLLNIPAAVPALVFTITAIPRNFPYHKQANRKRRTFTTMIAKETRARVDFIGAALLLLATLSLVAGFEEAGALFPWRSGYVISLLTVSGCLWIALLVWERWVTKYSLTVEPILPWRFMKNRVVIGLLLNAVFLGGPWFVTIFQLPQKFQLVHGKSALASGIRLIPFTVAAPIGAMVSSSVAGKMKVPPIYAVLCSGILQTIGFALLATLPNTSNIPSRIYGFQVIAGFGCGINISILILMVPFCVEFRDKAVGMGAVAQLRPMGGVIVLSIATSVFNSYTRPRLAQILDPLGINGMSTISGELLAKLPSTELENARGVLAHGYNLQMFVLCAFAAAQIPATLLMWQKKQITV